MQVNPVSHWFFRFAWIAYLALLLVSMACWAWSSPAGSSPDEDYHLVSSYCSWGTREGLCSTGTTDQTRIVSTNLTNICFAANNKHNGNCSNPAGQVVKTTRGNFTGNYPGGFYLVMGLLASPSVGVSVLLMRLLNALIYVGLLAVLLLATDPNRRSNYILVSAATVVPLGMFLIPSANPSSWAITSATLLWPSAIEFMRATDKRLKLTFGLLTAAALSLAVSSRGDASVFAAITIGLVWFMFAKRDRRTLISGGITAVIIACIYLWYRQLGQAAVLSTVTGEVPTEPTSAWFRRLIQIPSLWAGGFGSGWGLGWVDTAMPGLTWVSAGAVFAMLVFWGLRQSHRRKSIALLVVTALLIIIPMVIMSAGHFLVGQMIQPRYLLPLVILAGLIAISEDNPHGPSLNRAQRFLILVALTLANAAGLHVLIRRFVTGVDQKWFNLNQNIEWWWPVGPSPMLTFIIGSATFMGALLAALTIVGSRAHSNSDVIAADASAG